MINWGQRLTKEEDISYNKINERQTKGRKARKERVRERRESAREKEK